MHAALVKRKQRLKRARETSEEREKREAQAERQRQLCAERKVQRDNERKERQAAAAEQASRMAAEEERQLKTRAAQIMAQERVKEASAQPKRRKLVRQRSPSRLSPSREAENAWRRYEDVALGGFKNPAIREQHLSGKIKKQIDTGVRQRVWRSSPQDGFCSWKDLDLGAHQTEHEEWCNTESERWRSVGAPDKQPGLLTAMDNYVSKKPGSSLLFTTVGMGTTNAVLSPLCDTRLPPAATGTVVVRKTKRRSDRSESEELTPLEAREELALTAAAAAAGLTVELKGGFLSFNASSECELVLLSERAHGSLERYIDEICEPEHVSLNKALFHQQSSTLCDNLVALCKGISHTLGGIQFDLKTSNVVVTHQDGVLKPLIVDLESRWWIQPDAKRFSPKACFFVNFLLLSLHIRFASDESGSRSFGVRFAKRIRPLMMQTFCEMKDAVGSADSTTDGSFGPGARVLDCMFWDGSAYPRPPKHSTEYVIQERLFRIFDHYFVFRDTCFPSCRDFKWGGSRHDARLVPRAVFAALRLDEPGAREVWSDEFSSLAASPELL